MKPILAWIASMGLLTCMGCSSAGDKATRSDSAPASSAHPTSSGPMEVRHPGSQPATKGPPANFTGSVAVTQLFGATESTRASAGSVTFEPGARSHWHTHPLGQTLIVTAGTGWAQEWGGKKQEMKLGDVVSTPPGVKHWHGGTATESVTHIAVQEHLDGDNTVVHWMEPVTDEQYRN